MQQSQITRSKDIKGGTPVFAGTRVPVEILFEYIESDEGFVAAIVRRLGHRVILLHPRNNMKKLNDLMPLVPRSISTVETAPKGQLTVIRD